jgi:hypothetical protein
VAFPILIAEDMEQAAVDHVVEALAPVFEGQGIFDQESDQQPRSVAFRLALRIASSLKSMRVTSHSRPAKNNLIGYVDEGFLRLADVPGRLACIGPLEGAAVGDHGGSPDGQAVAILSSRAR